MATITTVRYHGSITDAHGVYTAVPDRNFAGRYELTRVLYGTGPRPAGGVLENVRPQSFEVIQVMRETA